MNSSLALKEEQQGTSSIELSQISKYRMPRTPLACFQDAATTAAVLSPDLDFYLITAPGVHLTFVQKHEVKQPLVARPIVSPLEFESNPIVRVYPTTGRHYPMRVVTRSAALFKLTPVRIISEETESTD